MRARCGGRPRPHPVEQLVGRRPRGWRRPAAPPARSAGGRGRRRRSAVDERLDLAQQPELDTHPEPSPRRRPVRVDGDRQACPLTSGYIDTEASPKGAVPGYPVGRPVVSGGRHHGEASQMDCASEPEFRLLGAVEASVQGRPIAQQPGRRRERSSWRRYACDVAQGMTAELRSVGRHRTEGQWHETQDAYEDDTSAPTSPTKCGRTCGRHVRGAARHHRRRGPRAASEWRDCQRAGGVRDPDGRPGRRGDQRGSQHEAGRQSHRTAGRLRIRGEAR